MSLKDKSIAGEEVGNTWIGQDLFTLRKNIMTRLDKVSEILCNVSESLEKLDGCGGFIAEIENDFGIKYCENCGKMELIENLKRYDNPIDEFGNGGTVYFCSDCN